MDRIEDGRMDSGQATCPLGWELEGDQRKGVRGRGNSTGEDLGMKSLFAEQPVVCSGHSVEVSGKG